MRQCTENHVRCNAIRPERWAPTRLLNLGSPGHLYVRLIESADSNSSNQPYATLSHCWGQNLPIRTLPENIQEYYKGIPYSELPKTFKDAIGVARSLSIRYLWVDSLCIIQDHEDWSYEAAQMSKVYRYGFINIAATGAADSTEGCHYERTPSSIQPTTFTIEWSNSQVHGSKNYQVVPESDLWPRKLLDEPLNVRGWVLQERILAPRVLHFGRKQLFWECREAVACETYHRGFPPSIRRNTFIDIKTLNLGDEPRDESWPTTYSSKTSSSGNTVMQRLWGTITQPFRLIIFQEATLYSKMRSASVYRDWDTVVELYSRQNLTYSADRLMALSGLAAVMAIDD